MSQTSDKVLRLDAVRFRTKLASRASGSVWLPDGWWSADRTRKTLRTFAEDAPALAREVAILEAKLDAVAELCAGDKSALAKRVREIITALPNPKTNALVLFRPRSKK